MSDTLLSTKTGENGSTKSFDPEAFSANLARSGDAVCTDAKATS